VIAFLLQIWMFASPVAYPISIVPAEWRLLYAINPLAGLIHGFRAVVLGETMYPGVMLVSVASAAAIVVLGVVYFLHVERRLADIV
jgi:lipopolysaccharide transport system permease protein